VVLLLVMTACALYTGDDGSDSVSRDDSRCEVAVLIMQRSEVMVEALGSVVSIWTLGCRCANVIGCYGEHHLADFKACATREILLPTDTQQDYPNTIIGTCGFL